MDADPPPQGVTFPRRITTWPVIISGAVSLAMLALGFNLLLPLGSGLEAVCLLTGAASAVVFFGLAEGA